MAFICHKSWFPPPGQQHSAKCGYRAEFISSNYYKWFVICTCLLGENGGIHLSVFPWSLYKNIHQAAIVSNALYVPVFQLYNLKQTSHMNYQLERKMKLRSKIHLPSRLITQPISYVRDLTLLPNHCIVSYFVSTTWQDVLNNNSLFGFERNMKILWGHFPVLKVMHVHYLYKDAIMLTLIEYSLCVRQCSTRSV